jgi:hypothetical protein
MDRHENPHIALANDIRLREAGSVGLIRSKGNACGLSAMGKFIFQPPNGGAVSGSGRRPKRY